MSGGINPANINQLKTQIDNFVRDKQYPNNPAYEPRIFSKSKFEKARDEFYSSGGTVDSAISIMNDFRSHGVSMDEKEFLVMLGQYVELSGRSPFEDDRLSGAFDRISVSGDIQLANTHDGTMVIDAYFSSTRDTAYHAARQAATRWGLLDGRYGNISAAEQRILNLLGEHCMEDQCDTP